MASQAHKPALVQVHLPAEYGGGSLTLKASEGTTVADLKEQAISRVTKKRLSVVEGPGQLRPQIFNMGRRCSNLGRSGNEFSVEDLRDDTVIGTDSNPTGQVLQIELRKADSAAENGFQYCISNHNGKFLGCRGQTITAGGIDDDNTTWTLLDGPDHCKLVQSPDGLYLTANKEGKVYLAPQGLWSQWEIQKGKRQFFRSHAHRTYLTQHADGHLFCGPKSQPGEFTICLALTRGYLKKKAKGPRGLKQWQSRYFIFNGRVLSYWHKLEHSDGEPAGAYAIEDITNVHVDEKKPCRFNVELKTEGKRAVHLLAATPSECQMWVQQLLRKGKMKQPVRTKRLSIMPSAAGPVQFSQAALAMRAANAEVGDGAAAGGEDAGKSGSGAGGKPLVNGLPPKQPKQPQHQPTLSSHAESGANQAQPSPRSRTTISFSRNNSLPSTPTSLSRNNSKEVYRSQAPSLESGSLKQQQQLSLPVAKSKQPEDLGTDYCVSNSDMLYLRAENGVYCMGPQLDDNTTFTFFNGSGGTKLLRDHSGKFVASDAAGNLFAAADASEPAAKWTIVRGNKQYFRSIYGMYLTTHSGSGNGNDGADGNNTNSNNNINDSGSGNGNDDEANNPANDGDTKSLHCSSKSDHAKFTICLVLVKGALQRRDHTTGGGWKEQYFIFNGKVLSYWDDVALIDSELPTDSFELATLKRSYTNPAHPKRFNVEFESGQTMELTAEDEECCRRWVKALTRKGVSTKKVDRRLSVMPGMNPRQPRT